MGPGTGILLVVVLFSASAMIALMSALQGVFSLYDAFTNSETYLGAVEMERHPPNAGIDPAAASGAGVSG